MRWWLRFIVTLVLTPLLWQLGADYLAVQQGASWGDLANATPTVLAYIYKIYSLPALVLCVILFASDALLHLLGIDLLTIAVSPLLAWAIAWAVTRFVPEPHVRAAAGAVALFVVYGLVWGLTIREPRGRRPVRQRTAAPEIGVPPGTMTEA